MRYLYAAAASLAVCSGAAFAQTTAPAPTSPNMVLSSSECTKVWQQANPSGAAKLEQSKAASYVSDFKSADANADMSLDQNEWLAACNKGLIKSSSSSGASSGSSGSSTSGSSGSMEK